MIDLKSSQIHRVDCPARDALQENTTWILQKFRMFPENTTEVPEDKVSQYQGLIDELEANDDVSDVFMKQLRCLKALNN